MPRILATFALLFWASPILAQSSGNMLRNGNFQDDWLTLAAELKNHHWCYSSEFYNRRDFNPDGWFCKGSWQWLNADGQPGQRRLLLEGPNAVITQRVNWVLVHDAKLMGNLADAGGFPSIVPQRSLVADRHVRDLTFRVRLKGQDVAAGAGSIELGFCPPGGLTISDPLGSVQPPTVVATVPIPEGTFAAQWVEVKLPAAIWLQASKDAAAKNPKEAAEVAKSGLVLPGTVSVAIRWKAAKGSVELEQAELLESAPTSPNLLANGSFEIVKKEDPTRAEGWSGPSKYKYFPGRLYYIFNTWHNSAFDNRGKVNLDSLIAFEGSRSLQMIVPSGDELAITSEPIVLKQKDARLIEVSALVKTDRLAVLNIDAIDQDGNRLDGFPFIHMAPHSIGSNDWRVVRQVFRPRQSLQSMRLLLCARGVNGYTLDDTGLQPQNNVVGTIWWDNVSVHESESSRDELAARGVSIPAAPVQPKPDVAIENLDLGERLIGSNVLSATLVNHSKVPQTLALEWYFVTPTNRAGGLKSEPQKIAAGDKGVFQVRYSINAHPRDVEDGLNLCPAYKEFRGELRVLDDKKQKLAATELWFSTWSTPIDVELGALYLRPEQKQFVRLNFGMTEAIMKQMTTVRLEVIRKGDGAVLLSKDIPASRADITAQRSKLPDGLRDDLTNLVLTDLDVSSLPIQPFNDPQRNWFLRVTPRDAKNELGFFGPLRAESAAFCRLAHEPPQPPITSVKIEKERLYVNNKPWMPWGVVYGHVPVYDGPADPGKYLDLHNLPAWSMYDRFTAAPYTRAQNDFNCMRYVAASITDQKKLADLWAKDNLYASTVFAVPQPAFSIEELVKQAGGNDKLQAYLAACKTAPMIVSTAPGIEEAFGLFHSVTPEQLKGLEAATNYLRKETGKPVMISHGGYWNRLEFEKVPFFDIFDPETEPLYPANLHTDLQPLVQGKDKVIWLRPQMYEDVPYERWRFHVYVELMRGCRGWQIAHGPGDQSLFRGLHGELEFIKPIIYSQEPTPEVKFDYPTEYVVRKHQGKTYVIAANTRGLAFGRWRDLNNLNATGRSRVTAAPHHFLSETNSYGADQKVDKGPSIHGVQNFPDAKSWPAGSKLVQFLRYESNEVPDNLVFLVKTDGRWQHAANWGKFDVSAWSRDPELALWFLRSCYRHAYGFLGWDTKLLDKAKAYIPANTVAMGELPTASKSMHILEVPLDKIGATGSLLDGVGFAHEGGRVFWGPTALVAPDAKQTIVWGNQTEPEALPIRTNMRKVEIAGLKKGTKVRVLFEDRTITAQGDGYFIDFQFGGSDLYQRFGGGYGVGYGNGPVAVRLYEIDRP